MAVWQAIVNDVTYNLSDGAPYHIEKIAGIGMAPTLRFHQSGPFQPGSTDLGFKLTHRFINIAMFFQASTAALADEYRDGLVAIFKPHETDSVLLRVTRDDGSIRQIDAFLTGVVDMADDPLGERMGYSQKLVVSLRCADPIWYNPSLQALTFEAVTAGSEGFQIPYQVAWDQLAGASIDASQTINYTGSWREYPVITLIGPAVDTLIRNETTGEELQFDHVVDAGSSRIIDLRYGHKTIVDENGDSKLSELDPASNLATFHLEPEPDAVEGVNEILVQILSGANTQTQVSMQYYLRYFSA